MLIITRTGRGHFATLDRVARLRDEVEGAGIDVEMLSGGYTLYLEHNYVVSEAQRCGVQAGSYVFSDWCSREIEGA